MFVIPDNSVYSPSFSLAKYIREVAALTGTKVRASPERTIILHGILCGIVLKREIDYLFFTIDSVKYPSGIKTQGLIHSR